MHNPYIDRMYIDRSEQIEQAFEPTLADIKSDPHFYAELVNDLMFHWVHGTKETGTMLMAKTAIIDQQQRPLTSYMNQKPSKPSHGQK